VFAASYQVTESTRDLVRRTEVYLACAKALRLPTWNRELAQEVVDVAAAAGAVPTERGGSMFFGRTRPRQLERLPPKRLTVAEQMKLARAWGDRLEREGLGENAGSGGGVWINRHPGGATGEARAGVFQEMTDFYWLVRSDLDVLHAWIEGATVSTIATRMGMSRSAVHRTIERLREQMPERLNWRRARSGLARLRRSGPVTGTPDAGQETGHADEGEANVDDRGGAG
jgi:hypothetical protein